MINWNWCSLAIFLLPYSVAVIHFVPPTLQTCFPDGKCPEYSYCDTHDDDCKLCSFNHEDTDAGEDAMESECKLYQVSLGNALYSESVDSLPTCDSSALLSDSVEANCTSRTYKYDNKYLTLLGATCYLKCSPGFIYVPELVNATIECRSCSSKDKSCLWNIDLPNVLCVPNGRDDLAHGHLAAIIAVIFTLLSLASLVIVIVCCVIRRRSSSFSSESYANGSRDNSDCPETPGTEPLLQTSSGTESINSNSSNESKLISCSASEASHPSIESKGSVVNNVYNHYHTHLHVPSSTSLNIDASNVSNLTIDVGKKPTNSITNMEGQSSMRLAINEVNVNPTCDHEIEPGSPHNSEGYDADLHETTSLVGEIKITTNNNVQTAAEHNLTDFPPAQQNQMSHRNTVKDSGISTLREKDSPSCNGAPLEVSLNVELENIPVKGQLPAFEKHVINIQEESPKHLSTQSPEGAKPEWTEYTQGSYNGLVSDLSVCSCDTSMGENYCCCVCPSCTAQPTTDANIANDLMSNSSDERKEEIIIKDFGDTSQNASLSFNIQHEKPRMSPAGNSNTLPTIPAQHSPLTVNDDGCNHLYSPSMAVQKLMYSHASYYQNYLQQPANNYQNHLQPTTSNSQNHLQPSAGNTQSLSEAGSTKTINDPYSPFSGQFNKDDIIPALTLNANFTPQPLTLHPAHLPSPPPYEPVRMPRIFPANLMQVPQAQQNPHVPYNCFPVPEYGFWLPHPANAPFYGLSPMQPHFPHQQPPLPQVPQPTAAQLNACLAGVTINATNVKTVSVQNESHFKGNTAQDAALVAAVHGQVLVNVDKSDNLTSINKFHYDVQQ